jgi:hypothetical protein
MPSNRPTPLWQRVQAALAPLDDHATHAAVWVTRGALALLIVSGETIRWVDYRDTLISAPTLRATHALAGFALAVALLLRIADAALRTGERWVARRRGVLPRAPAFHWQDRLTGAALLDAAWWLVVGLLVLSGLERYAQLRHGTTVLPVLAPAAWWAAHRPLLPYLYAILLINGLIRGRLAIKRVLSYLYTP